MKRIFLLGATASGKTAVSIELARRLGGQIVNFDALKVYRGMDIGTAKPSAVDRAAAPHHLIDIVEPHDAYNAGRFVRDARAAEALIGETAIYVGGTSLYYKALVYGLLEAPAVPPEVRRELAERAAREGPAAMHAELSKVDAAAGAKLHPNDSKRVLRALEVYRATGRPMSEQQTQFGAGPTLEGTCVFLERGDDDLRARIEERVRRQVRDGLEEEVRRLLALPEGWSREAAESVTYREMRARVRGELTLPQAIEAMVRRNWRLTRRQRTWMNTLPEVRRLAVAADEPAPATAGRIVEAVALKTRTSP